MGCGSTSFRTARPPQREVVGGKNPSPFLPSTLLTHTLLLHPLSSPFFSGLAFSYPPCSNIRSQLSPLKLSHSSLFISVHALCPRSTGA